MSSISGGDDALALIKLAQDDTGKYEKRVQYLIDLGTKASTKFDEVRAIARVAKQDRAAAEQAQAEASRISDETRATVARHDREHTARCDAVKAREDDAGRRERALAGEVTQRRAELEDREAAVSAKESASDAREKQSKADAAVAARAKARWEKLLAAAQAVVKAAQETHPETV